MKLVRYETPTGIFYGELENGSIYRLRSDFFGTRIRSGIQESIENVRLLHPTLPTKIINIAVNYPSHAGGRPLNVVPQPFLAAPSSALDPGAPIILPATSSNAHYEGEVAVVIGRQTVDIAPADVKSHVLGICCANDISERDWQGGSEKDTQWWRAKSTDTFSPFGPIISTDLDYNNLDLETRVNNKVVQQGNTSQLVFSIDQCISYISKYMTLEPGDLVFTGTPGITSALKDGDTVEVEVQGVGVLANPVTQL